MVADKRFMNVSGVSASFDFPKSLSQEDKEKIEELRKRDAEVKKHEQAHRAAAGSYAKGAPKYEYETGPDGARYAVGGEVQIDTAPIPGDPEATIRKAQTIKRAALAPAEPSGQDRQVAGEADRMMREAQKQLSDVRGYSAAGSPVTDEGSAGVDILG